MRFALGVAMSLVAASAAAGSFGDSKIVVAAQAHACQDVTLITLPLEVSVPSRIMTTGTVTTPLYYVDTTVYVQITAAAGSPILGVTASSESFFSTNPILTAQSQSQISASGIVHQGVTPLDANAQALVLQPGTYQAKLLFRLQNAGCGYINVPIAVLSYLLLSSAYDRVFADGFS